MIIRCWIIREIELARDRRKNRPKLDSCELNALGAFRELEAGQHAHEIVVPERAAQLAVGDSL